MSERYGKVFGKGKKMERKRVLRWLVTALAVSFITAGIAASTAHAASEEPVGLLSDELSTGTSSGTASGTGAKKGKHKTVYNGQDYSRVYDYDYYTTKIHPELRGQSDTAVLQYFVNTGIPNRDRGNKAFYVKWYYNYYPSLRYKYGRNWRKYYLYYQKKGYRKGPVRRCTKLNKPINYYIKDGKKISLRKIYNFEYYTKHNANAYVYWRTRDDAGAVKFFVKTGMHTGGRGNARYSPVSKKYRKYVKKIFPDYKDYEYYRAQDYTGTNGWLILINQGKHLVSVFTGSQNNWHLEKQFYVSIGSPSTPTVTGTYYTSERGLYFVSGSARCWYYTRWYRGYMFHSVLYRESAPYSIMDGRLGCNISHGCVRMERDAAKWIYDNVPLGTKVVSYNRPF